MAKTKWTRQGLSLDEEAKRTRAGQPEAPQAPPRQPLNGMPIYDLNRACMTGEHYIVFPDLYKKGLLACACGDHRNSPPVGFVKTYQVVYALHVDFHGRSSNYGVPFHPRALEAFNARRRS